MRRQGLKSTYLSARTNLIKCYKLSATTKPLLLHRCCYSLWWVTKTKRVMKKKLYLLSTQGLGDFYLVANSPNDAEDKLKLLLNKSDYGISEKRKVINIKLLAEELYNFPETKPNFSSGNTLILESSCENE
jgi:transcription elongation factor GreA-like protein